MPAVRRPGVTTALHILEGNRQSHAKRGVITIRDRQAPEAFAGDSYGKTEEDHRSLIGPIEPVPAGDADPGPKRDDKTART